jgi:primosomal protein N' (replication factor Y) (superfamily II helicase)
MSRTTLFADVLLPLPVKGTFTYRVPYEWNAKVHSGQRVAVQFGKRKLYAGLIRSIHENVPKQTPKYILNLLDEKPIVNHIQFSFWEWIASYYMCSAGEVMNAALPSAFKLSSESKVILDPDFKPDIHTLNEHEYQITEALLEGKRLSIDELGKRVGFQHVLPLLKNMIARKLILMEEELEGGYKPRMIPFVQLSEAFQDQDVLKELLDELEKRAYKQLEIVMTYLSLSRDGEDLFGEVAKPVLLKKVNGGISSLNKLIEKEVFTLEYLPVSRFDVSAGASEKPGVKLTDHQKKSLDTIHNEFERHQVVLLHGVTSGGKTEMYVKLIEEALQRGKQVLYLLPEIALTSQIINRLRKYFGEEVGIYHSRFNRDERAEIWNNIAGTGPSGINENTYKIILGPRSAIFLPFQDLGLIIIDEEHDQSYKQFDPAPRYNARDAAIYLSTLHNSPVLLGSATPAIESFFNAKIGKYGFARLTKRYGDIRMPEIRVVDMREEHHRRTVQSHFSSVLMSEINHALEDQHQAILFQNRRGFSLRLECDQCHWIPQCKQCDVTLTYHKYSELLKCHYCGYSTAIPASCGECGSTTLRMHGFGTEKVVEELSILLPGIKIDRMDLDSTRTKNAFQRIFSDFEEGKTDILTGTQMVTKGLDFDKVRLVGILSADNMLSFPDFRAHERSYQLMSQVSGRAGRKNKQGKVIIQTWQPDHPIISYVRTNNYEGMYQNLTVQRKQFRYPPFYRLINIKLKHKEAKLLNKASGEYGQLLRKHFGNLVFGPEYPMVSRIRNYYIKQILIKQPRTAKMADVKHIILSVDEEFRKIAKYKAIRVLFDVDPQ